ncbi:MAG: PAS domain S-box protein, partial [Candidatus Hodarchaeales archaeon]
SNIPFIIFTGKSREEIVIKALNLGANHYITKGSDFDSQYRELLHNILEVVERQRIEQALKESEDKYRLIFENEEDAILVLDIETRKFFDVNPAAERMYGYNRDEFLKLHVNDLTVEPKKTGKVLDRIKDENKVKIPIRYNRKKDGTIFAVEFTSSSYVWKNKKLLCTIVRESILGAEKRFTEFVSLLPQGIFEISLNGKFTFSIILCQNSWVIVMKISLTT